MTYRRFPSDDKETEGSPEEGLVVSDAGRQVLGLEELLVLGSESEVATGVPVDEAALEVGSVHC